MHKAVIDAQRLGLDTVQVFTKNQQQWRVPLLAQESIDLWKSATKIAGFGSAVSHDSYLINLASPDEVARQKSIALFVEEIRRCEMLSIPLLVSHPGAHLGTHLSMRDDVADVAMGCERIADSIDAAIGVVLKEFPKLTTTICLESTAGMGSSIGHKLEHLRDIINQSKQSKHLAVCLDTAHLFAAGYDFRGKNYKGLIKEIDQTIGLDRVAVWHLNDSKKPLGSHVDRHEHIGLGTIGDEGFASLVRDKRWKQTPKILETAKEKNEDGLDWDEINLQRLRSLMK